MPVGDPRRQAVGRAALGTLLTAAVFFVLAVPTKQLKPLYDHAPWENDPFDIVYSFAMFFVPLIAACFLVQVSLCRKIEPWPVSRVQSILRACRVVIATILITVSSCWISVITGANRSQWTGDQTAPLIAGLAVLTALTAKVVLDLHRAHKLRIESLNGMPSTDWLGDAIAVAERESRWLGPLRPMTLSAVSWTNRSVVSRLRRHPVLGAAAAALVFGLLVGANQGTREQYPLSATLLTIGLLIWGMFAFLMAAGSYLGIVRSSTPLGGIQRRVLDAAVTACAAAVVAVAFRDSLWWIVGSNQSAAGAAQFAALLGIATLAAFLVVLGLESMLRSHSRTAVAPMPARNFCEDSRPSAVAPVREEFRKLQ